MTRKKITVYFNLDDEDENLMFSYIKKKNKNQYIKGLIMNDIKGVAILGRPIDPVDNLGNEDLSADELGFED